MCINGCLSWHGRVLWRTILIDTFPYPLYPYSDICL
jgi:hypothetical protein